MSGEAAGPLHAALLACRGEADGLLVCRCVGACDMLRESPVGRLSGDSGGCSGAGLVKEWMAGMHCDEGCGDRMLS